MVTELAGVFLGELGTGTHRGTRPSSSPEGASQSYRRELWGGGPGDLVP